MKNSTQVKISSYPFFDVLVKYINFNFDEGVRGKAELDANYTVLKWALRSDPLTCIYFSNNNYTETQWWKDLEADMRRIGIGILSILS